MPRELRWRIPLRVLSGVARIVVGCLLAGGCGGPQFQPLNRATLRASQPRSIVAANIPVQPFTVDGQVSAAALFLPAAMIVASVVEMNRAGAAEGWLRRRRPIADPALTIRERLLEGMAKRFSLQVVNSGGYQTSDTEPGKLVAHYPGVDLILDVRTSDWGVRSFGVGNYGVSYDGTLTLVDARSGQLLARGSCSSHPVTLSDGASLRKLTADDAALLHEQIAAITDGCVEDYRKRLLGLY
jgi:hypothetical protein